MKRSWMVAVGLVAILTVPASAQMMGDGAGTMGMMGAGQGGAMEGCPGMGAQPTAFDPERPWISFALAHAKDLGLSNDRIEQLGGVRDAFLNDAGRLVADIRAAQQALTELYAQKPLDVTAIEVKIKEIAGREADFRIVRLKTLRKGTAFLTEEQRQKLFDPAWRMGMMMGAAIPAPPAGTL
jgi:hypothetical protein